MTPTGASPGHSDAPSSESSTSAPLLATSVAGTAGVVAATSRFGDSGIAAEPASVELDIVVDDEPEATVTELLAAGRLDDALEAITGIFAISEDITPAAVWASAARLAASQDRADDAEICFERAIGAAEYTDYGQPVLHLLVDACLRTGDAYHAAIGLAALVPDDLEGQLLAARCARIARQFADAGAVWIAERWYEQAFDLLPSDRDVSIGLLESYLARGDADAVEALADRDGRGGEWSIELADALDRLDLADRAATILQEALHYERYAQRAIFALIDLGMRRGRVDWIRAGAVELRARSLDSGDRVRAMLAASVVRALGGIGLDDRAFADVLVREVPCAVRVGAVPIQDWFNSGPPAESPVEPRAAYGEIVLGGGAEEAALHRAELLFGASNVVVRVVDAESFARRDPRPEIGLTRAQLEAAPASVAFHVGRLAAATLDPHVAATVGRVTDAWVEHTERMLDRAGLLVAGHVTDALDALEVESARGLALVGFCLSAELRDLWAGEEG